MSGIKPAVVRFYLDADVLGLAKLICQERSDCTYPGDPGAVIRKRRRELAPVVSRVANYRTGYLLSRGSGG